MRTGRIFWGVFFVLVGLLLLADRTGLYSIHWYYSWRLWPLIIVFAGIALLLRGSRVRWIPAALAGAALGVFAAGLLTFSWVDGDWRGTREPNDQEFVVPLAGATQSARLVLESGAGSCTLRDTTGSLFAASTTTSFGEYRIEHTSADGEESIRLDLDAPHAGWRLGRFDNRADIRLNAGPVWDLEFSLGAARIDCDLTSYNVERVKLNTGAAKVTLRLGGRAEEAAVDIDAGASSIRIEVPDSVGCRVNVDAPLSSKKFPGFTKVAPGNYRTDNYESASHRIRIDINAGVSSLKVVRY